MGKRNQIYGQYIRIMTSAEDPNEIYLVLRKDTPMEKKYIRQFDNMFAGKDVLITIIQLIRKKKEKEKQEEEEEVDVETYKGRRFAHTPYWDVEE